MIIILIIILCLEVFESLSRLLVVHWLDPYLPHSSKLCDEVFSLSQNYTTQSKSKPRRVDRKPSYTAKNGPMTTMPVEDHANEDLDKIPSKKPRLDYSCSPSEQSSVATSKVLPCKSPISTASNGSSAAEKTMTHVGVNSKRLFAPPRSYPSRRPPLSFSENQNPIEEAEFHSAESDVIDTVISLCN